MRVITQFSLRTLIILSPLGLALLGTQIEAQESSTQVAAKPLGAADQGRVLQLTLKDAVRIALEQNLDLEVERLSTEIANFNTRGSWGNFDPLASLSVTATDTKTQGRNSLAGGDVINSDSLGFNGSINVPFVSGGSFNASMNHTSSSTSNTFATFPDSTVDVLTLSLTQPLLKGAWSRYATTTQRQQEISFLRQQARQDQVRADLIQSVYNAYWDLVSAIEETSVRDLAVQRGLKQLDQDKRRLDLGAGTEVDVLQAETNVAQQEEALLRAGFDQRRSEDTLRQLLFQDQGDLGQEHAGPVAGESYLDRWDWPIQPLTKLPEVKRRDYDWRVSFDRALEQRAELVQSRLDIDLAEVQYDGAYSGYLPQLDFNLSSSSAGFSDQASDAFKTAVKFDFPDSRASLDFSMPVGNRSAKYALRAAEASIRKARLDYSKQELSVLTAVRAAVRDVIFRAEAVDAASKSAALALRQEQAEHLRMEIGLSTTFQVLDFQQTLAEANTALVLAESAYAKALAGLAHAEGRLGKEQEPQR